MDEFFRRRKNSKIMAVVMGLFILFAVALLALGIGYWTALS